MLRFRGKVNARVPAQSIDTAKRRLDRRNARGAFMPLYLKIDRNYIGPFSVPQGVLPSDKAFQSMEKVKL